MGSFGGSLGTMLGDAGTQLSNLPSEAYQSSGLQNLAQGLQSLFTGTGGDEAGYLQSLGQAVPQGVDLAGPGSSFTGPGFLGSLIPGLQGGQQYANPTAGTQLGQGVGQLLAMLEKLKQQGGGQMAPMVNVPGQGGPTGVQILPGYHQATAPSGGLVNSLIGSFTYGILGGAIPSGQQV